MPPIAASTCFRNLIRLRISHGGSAPRSGPRGGRGTNRIHPPARCNALIGSLMTLKDFEGQKLAETLATALLSVVGVCRHAFAAFAVSCRLTSVPGHLLPHRILPPRHQACSLYWARRHCAHVPRCDSAMAVLQPESRQMAGRRRIWELFNTKPCH
jgi:hypothetical protein